VRPGTKDPFPPESRGKLLFEDEPGKGSGKGMNILVGVLLLLALAVMIGAILSGDLTNLSGGNLLMLAVMLGFMGFMAGTVLWSALLSDKFRIYTGGITVGMKRRLPDGRWSSFYPEEDIRKIGFEQAGMLGAQLVVVLRDLKRDGTVADEKAQLSGMQREDEAQKALRDAFPEKWEETSRQYFEKEWSERKARKVSQKSSGSAMNWMLGLSWLGWILGTIPVFWPLFPAPKAVSVPVAFAILAMLGVLVARALMFRHREYRKDLARKARLASDGIEIPRTLYQRMFTDKPLVIPLGWVFRVTLVKPPGDGAPYTKVDLSFGESYDLPEEIGPKLVGAVPLDAAGEGIYENPRPDIPERPPGLRMDNVVSISAIFVLTNMLIGTFLFTDRTDPFELFFFGFMVVMFGFVMAPLFGTVSVLMISDALAVRRPAVAAKDLEPNPDWGAFLDEEAPEETALIRRVNLNAGAITIVLGMLPLVPGLLSLPFALKNSELLFSPFSFIWIMDIVFFLIAVLVIPSGIIMAVTAVRRRTWRMYENGILEFGRLSGKGVFIPYDRFSMIRETVSYRYGRVYELFTGNENVVMFSSNPRTRTRVELVSKKSGKPGLDPKLLEAQAEDIEKNTKSTVYWQLGALGVSALFSGLFAQLFIMGSWGDLLAMALTLFPMIGSVGLAFSLIMDYSPGLRRIRPKRFRPRLVMPFFAVPVAVLLVSMTLTGGFSESKFYSIQPGTEPKSSVRVPDLQENVTADLFDNMVVRSGEVKTMRNCNFTFQCKRARQYLLWVGEGGTLVAKNCTFQYGREYHEYFGVEFHGSVRLQDCLIKGLSYAESDYGGRGGLGIWGGPVEMRNCSVCNTVGMGLLIVGASPLFENCTFAGGLYEFVVALRSAPTFRNCTFVYVGTAVSAWDQSRVTLENCTVKRAFNSAVLCENSEVVLRGCRLENIRGFAFELHPPGVIDDRDTTFVNATDRLIEGPGLAFFDAVCFGANIVLVVLCPVAVWSYIGKHEREAPPPAAPDL